MEAEVYQRMANHQNKHWWFIARQKILWNVLQTLKLSPSSSILEIGCGTGGNLKTLCGFGKVTAIESNPFARKFASHISGIEVFDGFLPDGLKCKQQFDLICLFDVLEHVEDDVAALHTLKRLLAPGGSLLLTMPAYNWLFGLHDEEHKHFRRYTLVEVVEKAKRVGLQIERGGYFNSILFPFAVCQRMSQRFQSNRLGTEKDIPPKWLNNLLARIFSFESRIVPSYFFPFGLSVIVILRDQ